MKITQRISIKFLRQIAFTDSIVDFCAKVQIIQKLQFLYQIAHTESNVDFWRENSNNSKTSIFCAKSHIQILILILGAKIHILKKNHSVKGDFLDDFFIIV